MSKSDNQLHISSHVGGVGLERRSLRARVSVLLSRSTSVAASRSSRCRNNRGPGFGDGSRWVRGAGRDLASRGARRAGAGRHAGVHGVGAAGGPGGIERHPG